MFIFIITPMDCALEVQNDKSKYLDTIINESQIDESKIDNVENNSQDKISVIKQQNKLKLFNKQKLIMNNYKETKLLNKDLVLNNIYSCDDDVYQQIYNQIDNPYQKRLNIINLLLKSDLLIPMKNYVDIIRFFNWLSPFNNEYNMGSKDWAIKTIRYGNKEKILLQNSISKSDMGKSFYSNYIDPVKLKLSQSNVPYCYFEFKSKRFNKVKDIIWAFDKNYIKN